MPNAEQLALLKAGVEGWNKWRGDSMWPIEVDLSYADLSRADLSRADLSEANLSEANLSEANLSRANFYGADLYGADLSGADLSRAYLRKAQLNRTHFYGANLLKADLIHANLREADLNRANLSRANLSRANLSEANLSEANLSEAYLSRANFSGANLSGANLSRANLNGANLRNAILVGANVQGAILSKGRVYGVSVWDLEGEFEEQKDLIITPSHQASITVDNIEVAQFIYLILNNKKIRNVLDTLTSKSVLILGRFSVAERKAILDALRIKLRGYDLLPIVFDFDRPTDKDFTETIKTLAGMCYFVIADVTNPKSCPLELQATVPDYQIPFVPIIQEGEKPFAMMANLQTKYNWVLNTISYDSVDTLMEILKPHIIDPAIEMRNKLRQIKAQEPIVISGRELKEKKQQGKS